MLRTAYPLPGAAPDFGPFAQKFKDAGKSTWYKVYRWDPSKNAIASVGGWTRLDVK